MEVRQPGGADLDVQDALEARTAQRHDGGCRTRGGRNGVDPRRSEEGVTEERASRLPVEEVVL